MRFWFNYWTAFCFSGLELFKNTQNSCIKSGESRVSLVKVLSTVVCNWRISKGYRNNSKQQQSTKSWQRNYLLNCATTNWGICLSKLIFNSPVSLNCDFRSSCPKQFNFILLVSLQKRWHWVIDRLVTLRSILLTPRKRCK